MHLIVYLIQIFITPQLESKFETLNDSNDPGVIVK